MHLNLNLLECKEEQVCSKYPPVALKIHLSKAHSPNERDVNRKHRGSCWLTQESTETQTTPQDRELPIEMIHQSSSKAQSRVGSVPRKECEWKSSCTVGWCLQTSQHFWTRHSKSQSSVLPPKLQQLGPTEGEFVIKTQENNKKLQKKSTLASEFPNI